MSRRRSTSDRPASSGDAHGRVPSGYGERHVRTVWFGTGEARLASLVSTDRTYKPVVKLDGGKRESDGVVVLPIAGMNPAGGKGPDFGHIGDEGKHQGMTGTARSNFPDGHLPPAGVRKLHPDKTLVVDLREGRGLRLPRVSLPCPHVRQALGAAADHPLLPAALAVAAVDEACSSKDQGSHGQKPGRTGVGGGYRRLNRFLRGWGNYFCTGNAAIKFRQLDRYVSWRLFRLLIKKRGRNLHAGQANRWTEDWFHDQGLHKLTGTIRYPKAA